MHVLILRFNKLFDDISKHINYLDIFRFLQIYPDSEESESEPRPKIYNIRTMFNFKPKNSVPERVPGCRCLTDSVNK